MHEIKIGVLGTIVTGAEAGWNIFIQDESTDSGGYLILVTPPKQKSGLLGYDNWVEGFPSLENYFDEVDWNIEWLK